MRRDGSGPDGGSRGLAALLLAALVPGRGRGRAEARAGRAATAPTSGPSPSRSGSSGPGRRAASSAPTTSGRAGSSTGSPASRSPRSRSCGGEVWAATGEALWRRSATGTWSEEPLPSAVAFPTAVAVDAAGTLWAGGLGAWRRTGETWTAAPSPGRRPRRLDAPRPAGARRRALDRERGALERVGLDRPRGRRRPERGLSRRSRASAGRSGPGRTSRSTPGAASAWVADAAFGGHDVRALTTWGGVLRAATADAGVLARSGSAWASDSAGILPRGAQAFLESGGELFVGTSGRPRLPAPGAAGTRARARPRPRSSTDAVPLDPATDRGGRHRRDARRGAAYPPAPGPRPGGVPPALARLPDGCGDATAVARTASATSGGARRDELRAVPRRRSRRVTPAVGGPARRRRPTTLASHASTVFGGTAGSGLLAPLRLLVEPRARVRRREAPGR